MAAATHRRWGTRRCGRTVASLSACSTAPDRAVTANGHEGLAPALASLLGATLTISDEGNTSSPERLKPRDPETPKAPVLKSRGAGGGP